MTTLYQALFSYRLLLQTFTLEKHLGKLSFARSFTYVHFEHTNRTVLQNVKGKAIPLQPWTGPEGSSSLMLPDFMTIGT